MIFEYLKYPSEEEWNNICKEHEIINNLYLDGKSTGKSTNGVLDFYYNLQFQEFLMQFNNKLGEVRMTYIFLMNYFKTNIPDKELIKPGESGGIKYFPKFEDKDFYNKMMFDYYCDIFYHKFFSVWDFKFHLINIYYRLEIKSNPSFNRNVMDRLSKKDHDLFTFLNKNNHDNEMEIGRDFRNDLTHNYPPNYVGGIAEKEERDGDIVISGKVRYTSTSEFVNNINRLIELLNECIIELEKKFI